MINIKTSIKGKILTIEVDLSKTHGQSGSGKSEIIASTSGNVNVEGADDGIKMGLNIYKPVKK